MRRVDHVRALSVGAVAVLSSLSAGVVTASAAPPPALTPVAGSPFGVGSGPHAPAFSPEGRLLVVPNAHDDTVSVLAVDPGSGALTAVAGSPVSTGDSPLTPDFSPSGRLLAVPDDGSGQVSIYRVDLTTGALAPVAGSPVSTGPYPHAAAFSPSGDLLAVGEADGVRVFSVDQSSGALTQVPGSPFDHGTEDEAIDFSPSGDLLAAAQDAGTTVAVFSVDGPTGALTPLPSSPYPAGRYPHAVAFSPAGNRLAISSNPPSGTADEIVMYSVGAGATGLTSVPGSPFVVGNGSVDVAFNPSGDVLAAPNVNDRTTAVLSVGADGSLASVTGSPLSIGGVPDGARFSPSGGLLAVTDALRSQISIFTVGAPTATISAPAGGGSYALGESVSTSFTCADAEAAPGIVGCTDGEGGAAGTGHLDTTTPGSHTYSVMATSRDGQTTRVGIDYTVRPGAVSTTTTATTTAGPTSPAPTPPTPTVPTPTVPTTSSLPAATGSLLGTTLGDVRLAMTAGQVRAVYPQAAPAPNPRFTSIPLVAGRLRVGTPSARLLATLPSGLRAREAGRVVLALTANRHYMLRGLRAGDTLSAAAAHRLHLGRPFHVGLNEWYLIRGATATDVLKVRGTTVEEIGIASRDLTRTRHAQRRFITSFS